MDNTFKTIGFRLIWGCNFVLRPGIGLRKLIPIPIQLNSDCITELLHKLQFFDNFSMSLTGFWQLLHDLVVVCS